MMDTIKRSSLAVGVITRKNDQRQPPMSAACVAHFSGHAQHTDGVINRFRSSGAVSMSTAEQERYQRYLCSREWAEKREAVRARSHGYCERCFINPMDACHHLTYARKYNEQLEDLQAICDNCHAFTHGKTSCDRWSVGKSIYLAGKVYAGCWRHKLVRGLRSAGSGDWTPIEDGLTCVAPEGVQYSFNYVGPFFTSCDHGCCHGSNQHGNGPGCMESGSQDNRWQTYRNCRNAISECDYLLAWIDTKDCFGTLVEIGMAVGIDRDVIIGTPVDFDWSDLWFATYSGAHFVKCTTPASFANTALVNLVRRSAREWFPLSGE